MNDMSEAPKQKPLWARKGEVVTCVKGHPICIIARDIYVGDPRQSDHFENWKDPEPSRDANVAEITCKRCRGRWLRGNPREGYAFHFRDGWR